MNLNDNQKFLAIIGVGFLIIAGFSYLVFPFAETQGYDYETGMNVDTDTFVNNIRKTNTDPFKNAIFTRSLDKEIFVKDKYITSFAPEQRSQLITMQCQFDYNPLVRTWRNHDTHTVAFSRYYVTVDFIKPNGETIRIIDTDTGVDNQGNMWDDTYIEMVRSRFPPSSKHKTAGAHNGHLFPNVDYKTPHDFLRNNLIDKDPIKQWYWPEISIQSGTDWLATWHEIDTDTFEFYMKGTQVGALEANFYLEWADSRKGPLGGEWLVPWYYQGWDHLGTDSCYLASGDGSIEILSTNHIPSRELPSDMQDEEGLEQAEESTESGKEFIGDYYTKFVYEEGSTVEISVDTGFSGAHVAPGEEGHGEGWALEIYGDDGTRYKRWYPVPDNLRGKTYTYTIPEGSYDPDSNNEWRVVLRNTLFDEAQTRLFVVYDFEDLPGQTSVHLDKMKYTEGEEAKITLEAKGSDIEGFNLEVKYGEADSMEDVFYGKVGALKYASNSYRAIKRVTLPDKPINIDNLHVTAWAYDSRGNRGGEGTFDVQVEQKVEQVNGNDDNKEGILASEDDLLSMLLFIIVIIVGLVLLILYRTGRLEFLFQKGGGKR